MLTGDVQLLSGAMLVFGVEGAFFLCNHKDSEC
jgi:hypothetical protein